MPDETELTLRSGLGPVDYAAIAAYFALTFGIAWWFGRRQKSTEDFFVGGRRMPSFAVGVSILATLFSTLTYLGMPGEVIKHGLGIYGQYISIPVTACVITLVWIPFFMRLRMVSAYEYLEHRFSYPIRLVGAALFILLRLGWMSMVVYAASMALDRVKGPDLEWLPGDDLNWIVVVIGLTATVYTAVGGIQAMIWIDVLQMMLLLAGVVLAIVYVMLSDGTGPADWFQSAKEYGHTSPQWLNKDGPFDFLFVRMTIVTAMINSFFWQICTHGSDQVVLQRYFSTSSLKAARRSYFTTLGVDLLMQFLLCMAGLALLSFYLKHGMLWPTNADGTPQQADKLFPNFLGTQLPVGCAGLIIAAFLCDAIQTLEAGINSVTAVVTTDIVPRLRSGGRRMLGDLAVARLLTIGIALAVSTNAYFVVQLVRAHQEWNLVDMMPKFFNLFVGPLGGLFILGMFASRATTRSAAPAVAIGMTVSATWSWFQEIFGTDYRLAWGLSIGLPCIVTVLSGFVLSWLVEKGVAHPGQDFLWKSIIRRIPADRPEDPSPDAPEVH